MLTWLLIGTLVYVVTFFVPSLFLVGALGVGKYLGSRDEEPEASPVHGRAKRANRNFNENYPVFMGLGILALVVAEADVAMATTGAMIFVIARVLYLPLYMAAVPVVRSVVYIVGLVGLIMMGLALI